MRHHGNDSEAVRIRLAALDTKEKTKTPTCKKRPPDGSIAKPNLNQSVLEITDAVMI